MCGRGGLSCGLSGSSCPKLSHQGQDQPKVPLCMQGGEEGRRFHHGLDLPSEALSLPSSPEFIASPAVLLLLRHSFPLSSSLAIPRISRRWKPKTAYRAVLPLIVPLLGPESRPGQVNGRTLKSGDVLWGASGSDTKSGRCSGYDEEQAPNSRTPGRPLCPVANTEKEKKKPVRWAEWLVVGPGSCRIEVERSTVGNTRATLLWMYTT